MKNVVIITQNEFKILAELVNEKLIQAGIKSIVTQQSMDAVQSADVIVWLPNIETADQQVFDLVDQLDQRQTPPQRILMVAVAGVNEEVESELLQKWYGKEAQQLILGQQYAIKMIDELELPYTIVRVAPLTQKATQIIVTKEGQKFAGKEVQTDLVADYLAQIIESNREINVSIGLGGL